jgi:putative ABC transport system permease protein
LESWQPTLSGVALLLTSVFVFGAAGTVTPLLLGAVLALLRRTGGAVRIGVANLVSQPRRTTVTATTVAAAVALGCVLGALIPSIRGTLGRSAGEAIDGRVLVSTVPLNNSSGIDAKPSREVIEKLRTLPGVASLDRSLYAGIGDTEGYFGVFAQEGGGSARFERVAGETGPGAIARGDAVVGTSLARRRALRPGSTLRLPTPKGFRDVKVAGIWASVNNNGNSVEISPRRFEEIFGPDLSGEILLRPKVGVSAEELKRRVLAARLDPDLYALTPDEMVAQLSDEVAAQAGPFWALQRMMLFVALVGTLSTLLLVGMQRRRELGILGAVGFGPSALGRMTLTEGVATALAGSLVGVVGSFALFEALRNASATSVGARPPFAVDPVGAAVATGLAVVVVVVGSALPAWRTSRLQIVEAIRDE